MKLSELIEDYEIYSGNVSCDTEIKRCVAGASDISCCDALFVLPSFSRNIYEAINEQLTAKPAVIITERPDLIKDENLNILKVHNARSSYAKALSRINEIDYSKLAFIGVTGTNGKTTTATIIYESLLTLGKKCGFIGTGKILIKQKNVAPKNYSMTSPDPELLYPTIRRMQECGCEFIVMEASSHALALDKLSPIPFKVAVFCGLSEEHLDFHKTMEEYFLAKQKLIETACYSIIATDDDYGKRLYNKYAEKSFSVSFDNNADGRITNVYALGLEGSRFLYSDNESSCEVRINLPGRYNILNSALAKEAVSAIGVSSESAWRAVCGVTSIEGRCERIESDITVIIDYAHTPKALENLLIFLNSIKKTGQNMHVVFGCGGERDREKRPLFAKISELQADSVTVTSDNSRNEKPDIIFNDIVSGFRGKNFTVIPDRERAIIEAVQSAKKGDLVVIVGKGHERYIIDSDGYHDFDEREIIRKALCNRLRK